MRIICHGLIPFPAEMELVDLPVLVMGLSCMSNLFNCTNINDKTECRSVIRAIRQPGISSIEDSDGYLKAVTAIFEAA